MMAPAHRGWLDDKIFLSVRLFAGVFQEHAMDT